MLELKNTIISLCSHSWLISDDLLKLSKQIVKITEKTIQLLPKSVLKTSVATIKKEGQQQAEAVQALSALRAGGMQ